MCCSIVANVRTKKPRKNAKNWRRRKNATRRRYGRSVWRLANDAQVVQEIKCLIQTILMNVFAQETLSLIPLIQNNVYARETKFQTAAILVVVFALPIRFLTSITHSSAFVITVNYRTWLDNAVNIFLVWGLLVRDWVKNSIKPCVDKNHLTITLYLTVLHCFTIGVKVWLCFCFSFQVFQSTTLNICFGSHY